MILVVGPTPAFQRRMTFSQVTLGEVNRALEVEELASGKGANCARTIQRLKGSVSYLTFTGGTTGNVWKQALKKEGISTYCIETISSTRTCTTILEKKSKSSTELIENARRVTSLEVKMLMQEFHRLLKKAKLLVCIGTLPPGAPTDLYSKMIKAALRRNIPSIIDSQGVPLLKALKAKPCIVKINQKELGEALGRNISSKAVLMTQMKKMLAQGPLWVIVTDQDQKVFAASHQSILQVQPPKISVQNAIGSGDAMTAGLAFGSLRERNPMEVLKWGIACGAANASGEGYGRISPNLVRNLRSKVLISP